MNVGKSLQLKKKNEAENVKPCTLEDSFKKHEMICNIQTRLSKLVNKLCLYINYTKHIYNTLSFSDDMSSYELSMH